jgi:hypothetical protein
MTIEEIVRGAVKRLVRGKSIASIKKTYQESERYEYVGSFASGVTFKVFYNTSTMRGTIHIFEIDTKGKLTAINFMVRIKSISVERL